MASLKNIFTSVFMPKVKTNVFDLSHDVKMSFDMGLLTPTCCMEALPGDVFRVQPTNFLRFMPLISPVMHRVRVRTEYFFVPNRLVWPEWEKWITGDASDLILAPFVNMTDSAEFNNGSVADFLGYASDNVATGQTIQVSPIPLAAYRLIWDSYYRDQNLQAERFIPLVPGDNSAEYGPGGLGNHDCYRRAWMHDYFTSALPFAQKGDEVTIPLTQQDDIPVEFTPLADAAAGIPKIRNPYNSVLQDNQDLVTGTGAQEGEFLAGTARAAYDPDGSLTVDVNAGATSVENLRLAFRVQEWLERNARGGTRYVESIFAHFGTKSEDMRLQRPEYIGGGTQNMVISEVLATAQETAADIPVGNMAGHGISFGSGNRYGYRAKEHGYVIGIISVVPDTAYQQGVHRHLTRFDRLDYAWPTFANLGEQAILNKEVYMGAAAPDDIFGYIPRYAEYKFMNSRVAGNLKDDLAFWHLGRIFETEPALNEEFIECVPSPRIFAVTEPDSSQIVAHIINQVSVVRKLPRFGVPTI